jgi:hypothetical protein
MRFCLIKTGCPTGDQVGTPVMQQNQRDGTQPEIVKVARRLLVPIKNVELGGNFFRVPFSRNERPQKPKTPRRTGAFDI